MILRFDEFEIDSERRELRGGNQQIHVEPQVFDLLLHLVENNNRVISKDELLEHVWKGRIVSESTLSSRINAARRAIGDTGEKQAYIRTIARRGFLFAGNPLPGSRANAPLAAAAPGVPSVPATQHVTFCRTKDGVNLAVARVGAGPVLVKTANWLNHLEYDWQSPLFQPLFQHLASRRELVRYDARGTGLSDWKVEDISFAAFVRDLESVIDALQVERFSLLGISQGAAVAIAYAAKHPQRVDKLVLHGGYAQGRRKRGSVADQEQADAFVTLMRYGWGIETSPFMQAFSSIYIPTGTPEQVRWFTDMQRVSTSAETAVRVRTACDQIDVTQLLSRIAAPTLVTHSRNDHVSPFEQGRLIAASIANAQFVALESNNHAILPGEPAWTKWIQEIEAFLAS